MPFDRRIIVQVEAAGTRNDEGEYVPGAVTPLGVWARRRDISEERKVERGGTRSEVTRDWRVRWDSRIASTPVVRLHVDDGGETFTVIDLVEITAQRGGAPDLRRRFLDLQGIHS